MSLMLWSQYPLRWASSWWLVMALVGYAPRVSIPSQVGILLVEP